MAKYSCVRLNGNLSCQWQQLQDCFHVYILTLDQMVHYEGCSLDTFQLLCLNIFKVPNFKVLRLRKSPRKHSWGDHPSPPADSKSSVAIQTSEKTKSTNRPKPHFQTPTLLPLPRITSRYSHPWQNSGIWGHHIMEIACDEYRHMCQSGDQTKGHFLEIMLPNFKLSLYYLVHHNFNVISSSWIHIHQTDHVGQMWVLIKLTWR